MWAQMHRGLPLLGGSAMTDQAKVGSPQCRWCDGTATDEIHNIGLMSAGHPNHSFEAFWPTWFVSVPDKEEYAIARAQIYTVNMYGHFEEHMSRAFDALGLKW